MVATTGGSGSSTDSLTKKVPTDRTLICSYNVDRLWPKNPPSPEKPSQAIFPLLVAQNSIVSIWSMVALTADIAQCVEEKDPVAQIEQEEEDMKKQGLRQKVALSVVPALWYFV